MDLCLLLLLLLLFLLCSAPIKGSGLPFGLQRDETASNGGSVSETASLVRTRLGLASERSDAQESQDQASVTSGTKTDASDPAVQTSFALPPDRRRVQTSYPRSIAVRGSESIGGAQCFCDPPSGLSTRRTFDVPHNRNLLLTMQTWRARATSQIRASRAPTFEASEGVQVWLALCRWIPCLPDPPLCGGAMLMSACMLAFPARPSRERKRARRLRHPQ
eukprot:scaffold385_cov305-Pinguiococcus_pyrenoidosus.AAC.54